MSFKCFKSKNVLFCGNVTKSSAIVLCALLEQEVKSVQIANSTVESVKLFQEQDLDVAKLSHCNGDLTKIADLEIIYTRALARSKKKLQIIVNHKELNANDHWEDVITTHINALICSTLMAIKHLGSMNSGCGGTVINLVVIAGRSDEEYSSIHRLLTDLDRSFSDPYYFNNTAVQILTMCIRMQAPPMQTQMEMELEEGSENLQVDAVLAQDYIRPVGEPTAPMGEVEEAVRKNIVEKFLQVCMTNSSYLEGAGRQECVEEFEISVRS